MTSTCFSAPKHREFAKPVAFLVLFALAVAFLIPAAKAQSLKAHFKKAVPYALVDSNPLQVVVADLNGDGKADLITASPCSKSGPCGNETIGGVSVLLGNGDGTFQTAVTYQSGGYDTSAVAVGDVNGDGIPDLIVANPCASIVTAQCSNTGSVSILLGNGDGTFQAAISYDSLGYGTFAVAVGDLNGDGKLDIVLADYCQAYNNCDNGGVDVLLGNGDGTFQTPVSYSSGGYGAGTVLIADLNGDGHPDLAVANYCLYGGLCGGPAGIGILLGNGDGTFQAAVGYSTGAEGSFSPNENQPVVAVGDINGDGVPDLAVAERCLINSNCEGDGVVAVMLGKGDGSFRTPVLYDSGAYFAVAVAISDVNGDGRADVAVANQCLNYNDCQGEVSVLLGIGGGKLQAAQAYYDGGNLTTSLAVADVNGDGEPDIVVTSECNAGGANCTNPTVGVLLNSPAKTTLSVISTQNPVQAGHSVTFTATITANPPVLNGEIVTFYAGSDEIGTRKTIGGVASLNTSFSKAGSFTLRAVYAGDTFHKSSSGGLKQTVNP